MNLLWWKNIFKGKNNQKSERENLSTHPNYRIVERLMSDNSVEYIVQQKYAEDVWVTHYVNYKLKSFNTYEDAVTYYFEVAKPTKPYMVSEREVPVWPR